MKVVNKLSKMKKTDHSVGKYKSIQDEQVDLKYFDDIDENLMTKKDIAYEIAMMMVMEIMITKMMRLMFL